MKKSYLFLAVMLVSLGLVGCGSEGESGIEYHSSAPKIEDKLDAMELPDVLPSTGQVLD